MDCTPGRIPALGNIRDSQNQVWVVPAAVEFNNSAFPFASDLYNACIGKNYSSSKVALAALTGTDIVTIDQDGELITGYIFADNYFEMYVNGKAIGKDKVPFTEFNSCIVRFRVKRPFTIAMLLVDWEEALGLGTELNGGFAYHPGDGGMAALFTDSLGNTVAITNENWKAQTYYTAPVKDLSCPYEVGNYRYSNQCNTASENDGSNWYGLHWKRPENWMQPSFSDTAWPAAFTYTNTEIGVNNKPSYTNFTDVFDKPGSDAKFIWSSNLILDNEVLVRYRVESAALTKPKSDFSYWINNPVFNHLTIHFNFPGKLWCAIFDQTGREVISRECKGDSDQIDVSLLKNGVYILEIRNPDGSIYRDKILILNQ